MNKKASFQRKLKVLVVLGLYMILMSGCGLSDSGTVNTVTNDDTGTVSELVFSFLKVHSRAENGSILMNWENLSEEKYSKVEIVAEPVGGKNGKKIEITIPRGYHDEELIAEENMRY